jgi:hypothetical protein
VNILSKESHVGYPLHKNAIIRINWREYRLEIEYNWGNNVSNVCSNSKLIISSKTSFAKNIEITQKEYFFPRYQKRLMPSCVYTISCLSANMYLITQHDKSRKGTV